MSFFTIEVQDGAAQTALKTLQERLHNVRPALAEIGEDVVEDAKRRFETSTGPDGQKWAPNSMATIMALLTAKSGQFAAFSNLKSRKEGTARVGNKKGYFDEEGKLGKKGIALVMSKKPLIGESGDLRRQINYRAESNSLTIQANPIYAAIQQFGGSKSEFPKLWGDIPARPFLPVKKDGALYPRDEEKIVATLNRWLSKS